MSFSVTWAPIFPVHSLIHGKCICMSLYTVTAQLYAGLAYNDTYKIEKKTIH